MSVSRRHIVIGGACLAAAGTAAFLRPRERLVLLKDDTLAASVPETLPGWTSFNVDNLIAPEEGSLAATLYSENVGRVYENAELGAQIMMLLAYGDTQSDRLQLHRPEVCYPAFGFDVVSNKTVEVPLGAGRALPARELFATAPGRDECILYWARLGEHLPTDGRAQRMARLETAMDGKVADGLLARFSIVAPNDQKAFQLLRDFVTAYLAAVPARIRPAYVGSALAGAASTAKT